MIKDFFNELKQYLTPVNTIVIGLCILVFIAEKIISCTAGDMDLSTYGAVGWKQVLEDKEFYRIFTYMFLHAGVRHLFSNMLVLLFVGSTVEKVMGSGKYLVNYLCSGVVSGLVSIYYNKWRYDHTLALVKESVVSVGASGAIFGTVGALFWLVLINKGRVEGISTRRMILFIILSIYAGYSASGIDNAAHIGGLIFGIISAIILYNRKRQTV